MILRGPRPFRSHPTTRGRSALGEIARSKRNEEMASVARLWVGAALVVALGGCTVSEIDYSGRSCQQAVDCPAPFVCVSHGGQFGTCVTADQGVPTTDGGSCDVTTVSFSRDVQPVFTARCTQGGCHSAANPAGEMSLTAPGTVARLVNQPTSAGCSSATPPPSIPRVKPGDPHNSMIWRKTSSDGTECGDAMPLPFSLSQIAPCEFARLEAWIQQGALDN